MKFYLEIKPAYPRQIRAHIAQEETYAARRCVCAAELNLEKWRLVEQLPEDVYLCENCRRLAQLDRNGPTRPDRGGS